MLPKFASPSVATLPEIGAPAPRTPLPSSDGSNNNYDFSQRPTLVAFVRHCGCPFAEKEIRLLADEVRKNGELRVVVVQHSEMDVVREWWDSVGYVSHGFVASLYFALLIRCLFNGASRLA